MVVERRIEIHHVQAHRVDGDRRVRGVRVLGVADRRDRKVMVTLSPRNDGRLPVASLEFGARQNATFVRPEAIGMLASSAAFMLPGSVGPARAASLWCADFELDDTPQFPQIRLGLQSDPLTVEARYLSGANDESALPYTVDSLALVAAYPVGVLFVHGIGAQKKAETLSQWTAPLLGWIKEWFDAAGRHLGHRAEATDLEAWLATHLVREDLASYDQDFDDRLRLATAFGDQTVAKTYSSGRDAVGGNIRRLGAVVEQRALTAEEEAGGTRFEAHLRSLGASIVGGTATLADARLIDGAAPVTVPSTVEIRIAALSVEGEVERSTWLMAESHWAESFRPPPFGRFAAWCLRAAPVLWVHYVVMIFARTKGSWARVRAVVLLASAVLVMVVAFALLLVLAVVPWPRLRAQLMAAQQALAGVVGDSYVFVKDAVQRRAIIDRVRRDVDWLSERCRKVVVVAHSQGAAAADQALSNPDDNYNPARLDTLVTLGAGVQTLRRLADLGERPKILLAGSLALAGVAVCWAGVVAVLMSRAAPWSVGAALLGAVTLLLATLLGRKEHPGLPSIVFGAAMSKPWHDFFATRDPVPWGPLGATDGSASGYLPHEVMNRQSFVTDHTSYWQNIEEVVGPVARLIAGAAGFTALDRAVPDVAATQEILVAARHTRVRWLRCARAIALLCTLALCVAEAASLAAVAEWGWGIVAPRIGLMPDKLALFPGSSAVWRSLAVVAPYLIYFTLLVSLWAAWGAAEGRKILRAQGDVRAGGWRLGFAAIMVVAAAGVIAALIATA